MPASDQATAILPGLSPICGRAIEPRFDGELMSSDGGLLVLREVEQRLGIAGRLAGCIRDPRAPERIVHGLDEIMLGYSKPIGAKQASALAPIVAWRSHPEQPSMERVIDVERLAFHQRALIA